MPGLRPDAQGEPVSQYDGQEDWAMSGNRPSGPPPFPRAGWVAYGASALFALGLVLLFAPSRWVWLAMMLPGTVVLVINLLWRR